MWITTNILNWSRHFEKTNWTIIILFCLQTKQTWELVGIDLVGPFKETSTGFKYVMTRTCLFSKWVEAEPIKAKSAECVCEVLVKWIHRWGVPLKILSDRGKEFNNNVCNRIFSILEYAIPEYQSNLY